MSPSEDFLNVVREGRSFSGREAHCAFLNLGDGTFCDVSAVSGFDLTDDGRAAALVDWDGDGDLDVWLSNRNGPQVRFLANQDANANNFLAIKVRGTLSNRDAIGARVQVFLDSDGSKPLTRTVTAGNGFLSQSSKWLHFGLGRATKVDRVVVLWPSGSTQAVAIKDVNCRYRITEGEEAAIQLDEPRNTASESSQKLAHRRSSGNRTSQGDSRSQRHVEPNVSALCFSMIHLPATSFTDLDGSEQPFITPGARSVLVNLWASWCVPCVSELAEFTRERARINEHGVDVVALCVDGVAAGPTSSNTFAGQLLRDMQYPFRAGRADRAMLDKLQLLHDTFFEVRNPLPIPTSFLLDRQGRVTAIYQGPVTVDQLLADKAKLAAKTTEQWRMATLPFPGRWIMPPRRRHLFDFVSSLAEKGYFQDCVRYLHWNQKMLMSHPSWPDLSERIQRGLGEAE